MSLAVLARAPTRRLRPGVRRALMAGASTLLHTIVLGAMILLASSEDHPAPSSPSPPPIIQLEIERPPLPPLPRPPVSTPRPLPLPTPELAIPEPQPERPTPAVAPLPLSPPTPQPAPRPAPQPAPQPAPKSVAVAPPAPVPAPQRAPAPVPAPLPAPPPAAAAAAAERAAPTPAPALPIRARKKDEDEARDGLPAAPAPRLANPAPGAPSAAASGVDGVSDAWRVAPEGQAGRNARALRTSPAGCPSTRVLRPGEQAVCDDRFNARAAEGAARGPITGSGNAERDARFAREGTREMQRYEAQRRPLSGGVGVMPPQDCPGSNFGAGCAGAHLDPSMRQGATTNVQQDSNKLPEPRP
ncbi:hypothetical protein D3C73_13420 [compost metagenome]